MSGRDRRVGFFAAHPAQLWMLHAVARALPRHIRVFWVARQKDCVGELVEALGLCEVALLEPGKALLANASEFLKTLVFVHRFTRRHGIDLWLSKYGAVNICARMLGVANLSFNDDADIVPLIAATSYPFADRVLCPHVTRMGRYAKKALRYNSFHELFYLHPARFRPSRERVRNAGIDPDRPYCIIRLSALQAHHDVGVSGISDALLAEIVQRLSGRLTVYISSEKPLKEDYRRYRWCGRAADIHHALSFARLFVGDSQTMTAEAAVLGTPAIRISDFSGRLSYLAELERYGLAESFRPADAERILQRLDGFRFSAAEQQAQQEKRRRMLAQKIDPVPWMVQRLMEWS